MDAVIFDFGGVLTNSPTGAMAKRAAEFGYDLRSIMPLLLGPLEVDGDHPWHQIERGEITMAELEDLMAPIFAAEGLDRPMTPPDNDELHATMTAVPEMIDAAAAVRASGRRTAILSNNIRDWDWRPVDGADDLVDVIVDSSEVGLRKPDEAIYRLTTERLGVDDPSRCLFLDDFVWNLAPAQRIGMATIHVADPVDGAAELRALLGV